MRTYAGEDRARHACPPVLLDGTQEAAQAYVDRITRSAWWRKHCAPSWLGDDEHGGRRGWLDTSKPPRRIIVVATKGAGGRAGTNSVYKHRGKWFPRIRLGTAHKPDTWTDGWLGAIRDPYVILHEVAHIMAACDEECGENGHGRWFRYYLVLLVARWMGPEPARALKAGYEAEGLKWRKPPRKG